MRAPVLAPVLAPVPAPVLAPVLAQPRVPLLEVVEEQEEAEVVPLEVAAVVRRQLRQAVWEELVALVEEEAAPLWLGEVLEAVVG